MSKGIVIEKLPVKLSDEDRELRDTIEARVRPKFAAWMKVSEAVFGMPEAIDWVEVSTDFSLFASRRLYLETHTNFQDYLFDRWGVSRSWGHQIIRAGKAILALPEGSEKPKSIRAALSLAKGTSAATATDEPEGLTRARANGHVPADAEVTIVPPDVPPDAGPEVGAEVSEPTDEEWLATLPARGDVCDRLRPLFDDEALTYRDLEPVRKAYQEACKARTGPLKQKHRGHIGPWLAVHGLHFKIDHPAHWRACSDCKGQGILPLAGAKCGTCNGHGYHVR